MRSLLLPAAAVLGFVTALGCGGLVPDLSAIEPEPPPDEAWVGTWISSDDEREITLDIAPDGMIQFSSQSGSTSSNVAGPAESWDGELTCCFGFKKLTIDAPPTEGDDGTWTLQLDGRTYVREPRELPPDEL